jgi:hypothetical protein
MLKHDTDVKYGCLRMLDGLISTHPTPMQKAQSFHTGYNTLFSENGESFKRQRGKNKFLVAVGFDSKQVLILDLDDLHSGKAGFKVLTELPLRYGLNGASVAAHGDFLVNPASSRFDKICGHKKMSIFR